VRYLVESDSGGLFEQPETHAYLRELRAALEGIDPDVYLVGEIWTARFRVESYYGEGDELHQAFDFDLQGGLEQTLLTGDAALLGAQVRAADDSDVPWAFVATFANNHDLDRLAHRLPEPWQQRAAATLLLTLPGTPYLYYGDELGMQQGSARGDEAKRTPMAWDETAHGGFTTGTPWHPLSDGWQSRNVATQLADEGSLLRHYRALIALRRAHSALGASDGVALVEAPDGLFAMLRHDEAGALLVVVNVTGEPLAPGTLDLSAHGALLGAGPWAPELVFGTSEAALEPTSELEAVPLGSPLAAGAGRVLRLR
jgi:alpha-amylase